MFNHITEKIKHSHSINKYVKLTFKKVSDKLMKDYFKTKINYYRYFWNDRNKRQVLEYSREESKSAECNRCRIKSAAFHYLISIWLSPMNCQNAPQSILLCFMKKVWAIGKRQVN